MNDEPYESVWPVDAAFYELSNVPDHFVARHPER